MVTPITISRPAVAVNSGGHFIASDWKPFTKNTLRGFCTLTLPSGMVIHGCTVHEKNDSRWLGLPAQQYTKADGTKSWSPIIEFVDKQAYRRFQDAAIAAVGQFLGDGL